MKLRGEIDEIDGMFGNYSVGSHFVGDFYQIRYFLHPIKLPYYTLAKRKLGRDGA